MTKSKPDGKRTLILALILALGGCNSVGVDAFGRPIKIAPSTFCQVYQPVRGGADADFWDRLEGLYPEQAATIRGNNLAYIRLCTGEGP